MSTLFGDVSLCKHVVIIRWKYKGPLLSFPRLRIYGDHFLVVAPTSVLNNWADEISKFCPDLKIIPYWGGLQERTILRKKINPMKIYRRFTI